MSASARANPIEPAVLLPQAADASPRTASSGGRVQWRWLLAMLAVLAIVYLSMLNPYWVPSGDGEVYTCTARSLVLGHGLTFNGARTAIAPPGWSLVLSWAMRISPEFWFLKLVTTSCMLTAMATAFFVVRRFASDRTTAGVLMLTGTLSSIYPLTFWMHTEAFFCVLSFASLLIAFRISEGRAKLHVEGPLMLLLLGFGAFTRWPGVLHIVLVAPILLSGAGKTWRDRGRLIWIGLAVVACAGTYAATKTYLSLTPEQQLQALIAGGVGESDTGDPEATFTDPTTLPTTLPLDTGDDYRTPDTNTFKNIRRTVAGEIAYRVAVAGKWFAWLLWQPTRFGQSVPIIDISALLTGWLSIGLLVLTMLGGIRQRDYFWLGIAIYTGGLCILWPNPNARYFVPVAPFIIVGIIRGIGELRSFAAGSRGGANAGTQTAQGADTRVVDYGHDARFVPTVLLPRLRAAASRAATPLLVLFVVATLAVNLPLLALDISIFRSSDFYGRYEAGSNKELIGVAQHIVASRRDSGAGGRIVVNERYENMGRARYSNLGKRVLHLLTNEQVIGIDRKNRYRGRPSDEDVRRWLRRDWLGAQYYVYQSAWFPWRVWHFRLSPEMQQRLSGGSKPTIMSGGWELFARRGNQFLRVEAEMPVSPPTRVPGL